MSDAVIVDCLRTPVGKATRGALRNTRPDDLAAAVVRALLAKYPQVPKEDVEDVILGCAMPEAESGSNMARMVALRAGLPVTTTGVTINRFCSSGLQSIAMAADRIRAGGAHILIAGGSESMSMIPMAGNKPAPNPWFVDHYPQVYINMGLTAEEVQRKYKVSREAADTFSYFSHRNALRAQAEGRFTDEIVPVKVETSSLNDAGSAKDSGSRPVHTEAIFDKDEGPRADTSLEALANLKPVFHVKGTVTAGNSSQTSDGAAVALVMSATKANELGLTPKARFVSFATAGVPPEIMGIGPVVAIPKALALAGLRLRDIDLIELNEAFAVQALAVIRAAGLDPAMVNVNGGAIALGHPLGCTGAKLTATILREMERRKARYGLVTMCVGGGQGAAEFLKESDMATNGGSFLIEDQSPRDVFTPEDLTEEHHDIARTAREFFDKEVVPHVEEMQHGDFDVAVSLLRKAAALGLESVLTPEQYGGMEMDLTSDMVVAEQFARDGSFGGWHGAHAGIGTLPLLLFGTEAQKQKYLPNLSSAETVAAYCLSEPQAGSDALAAKTRADLSPDGTHYILNGQKMWITNGGKAGLYTVFAKIHTNEPGGEKFTAFLVERAFPGVSNGAEEKKMGIKGSSTTPVFFDNVSVPVENVLGEIGRGHIIAFNILNLGRLKLGAFAVGGSRNVLQISIAYAKDRKAFGATISHFGMIQHKLAEMAIRIFAAESMTYRVEGLIRSHLAGFSWTEPGAAGASISQSATRAGVVGGKALMKAVEEFAAECSIIKVYASEMLDYVVDEGVQIHGGYGYHQDYAVERAYRDSRINRIFEGTNEINRLLITGMLLKRAQQGRLGLVKAAKSLMDEVLSGPSTDGDLVSNAKKIALLLMALAFEKYGLELEKQQEVIAGIADVIMETFAMESSQLRSRKNSNAADLCAVLLPDSMARIEMFARPILAACSEGDALRANLAILRRFAKFEPPDSIGLRRRIAEGLLAAGRYVV